MPVCVRVSVQTTRKKRERGVREHDVDVCVEFECKGEVSEHVNI